MIDTSTGKPETYADLFEHYHGFVLGLVLKAGIRPQDAEDVASEILLWFMEKDALTWYDPAKVFDVGPNPNRPGPRFRTARFSSLLRRVVLLRVRKYLDIQYINEVREKVVPHTADEAVSLEFLAPPVLPAEPEVLSPETQFQVIRGQIQQLEDRIASERARLLLELFDYFVARDMQGLATPKQREISQDLGWPPRVVTEARRLLTQVLSGSLVDVPATPAMLKFAAA